MGTNYYWIRDACPTCGHGERVHIGKSSAGWVFSLHVHPEDDISSLDDWIDAWRIGTIVNEYGETISVDEMLLVITARDEPGPDGLARHEIDGRHCIGHGAGSWDLCVGDFL